jgi:nicotinamidase/pyrazinamidase
MATGNIILWSVDIQKDFMLPGGKLYVPGAEKLLGKINELTDVARRNEALLVSHGCFHPPDDPEFKQFPPHCLKGTEGAEFVPEAMTRNFVRVENHPSRKLPDDLSRYQQIVLEKQTLDIFETHHAHSLVERLGTHPEFIVFGVVTEYCVKCASNGLLARKRKVSVVKDAIETLDPAVGATILSDLQNQGANLITTEQALAKFRTKS